MDWGWVHRLGIPPPWRRISVSENIIAIGSRTAVFPVVRLLSYEGRFFQIPNGPLYSTAGQRQLRSDRFDPRPCFSLLIHPVMQIEVHQLGSVGQLAVFI